MASLPLRLRKSEAPGPSQPGQNPLPTSNRVSKLAGRNVFVEFTVRVQVERLRPLPPGVNQERHSTKLPAIFSSNIP